MDFWRHSIQKLISGENPKRPWTDQEIAQHFSLSRGHVTAVRKSLGIADSRERLKPGLREAVEQLSDQEMSARAMTAKLNQDGFKVSRFIVNSIIRELKPSPDDFPALGVPQQQHFRNILHKASTAAERAGSAYRREDAAPFLGIVGYDGSLAPQIQLAKAAVLYPPKGLHTLIIGSSGTGKGELAEAMHRFAVQARGAKVPFVAFNCADYSDNPQLLLSQLFGHVKGAYTGADSHKEGLIEKADGGLLFLDEVHRLPAEGQEMLFQVIDYGRFRRLGEADGYREAGVMIIAATTEDPAASLLLTFRRRIPMLIKMPVLVERPLAERLALVRRFFRNEATRTETVFRIRREAVKALLLYDCPGNVGQLKSDIQVTSAKSFLAHLADGSDEVEIEVSQLPEPVRHGLFTSNGARSEVEKLLSGDWVINPGRDGVVAERDDIYTLPGEIYHFIEKRYQQLKMISVDDWEINCIIGGELDQQFRQHIKYGGMHRSTHSRDDLIRVVGKDVVGAVEKVFNAARLHMPLLDENVIQCLALHFHVAFERIKTGKPIKNPYLDQVRREYGKEWDVAVLTGKILEAEMGFAVPEAELGFIAMYLRGASQEMVHDKDGQVGILVMMHGKGIASGMVDVGARLLGSNQAKWLEMSLDESPQSALERAVEAVRDTNQGKGVLILADMGSLLTFGEFVSQKTGIPTRTIGRAETTMVIEAIRKAAIPSMTLEDIYTGLLPVKSPADDKKAVLITCITGKGLACKLAGELKRRWQNDNLAVSFIPCSPVEIPAIVQRVGRDNVIAAVGSVNPMLKGVRFFEAWNIPRGPVLQELKKLLSATAGTNAARMFALGDLLSAGMVFLDLDLGRPAPVIEFLAAKLAAKGYVEDGFVKAVMERETMIPTFFGHDSAVPHGDVKFVRQPSVAVARLKEPCPWGEGMVRFVFLMAITPSCSRAVVQLYNKMANESTRRQLENAVSREAFVKVLSN